MPYAYAAGDYYRGDYYGGNYAAGDSIFSKIAKIGGKLIGGIIGASPIGGVVKTFIPSLGGGGGGNQLKIMAPQGAPEPGIKGKVHRAIPGGSSGYGYYNKNGEFIEGRRPRMNVANVRALKRAGRRVRGFLKVASRLGALPISRSGKGKLFKRKRR